MKAPFNINFCLSKLYFIINISVSLGKLFFCRWDVRNANFFFS